MQHPITALDGRYKSHVAELSDIVSEFGLMNYRVQVEIEWLFFLKKKNIIPHKISLNKLKTLKRAFGLKHCQKIKDIEKTTRHDVKAVEYFLREYTDKATWPWIHFACTSEDINNVAYTLQTRDSHVVVTTFLKQRVIKDLKQKAVKWKSTPMLSRTHGQPATPTTMGKEVAVFVYRLEQAFERTQSIPMSAKWNGASGVYAAHTVTLPNVNWIKFSQEFIESFDLEWNPLTTQIESHDNQAASLDSVAQLSSILIDLCSDMWGYISIGYFGQKMVKGEVGSSTMPHKVNPIDFENARGNFKIARGIARTLSDELPISMWQRDISDSTLQRNLGLVFGHFLVGLKNLERGLSKVELQKEVLSKDLEDNPEVLTEAIQTVLRKNGHADAYEQLKKLSRGKRLSLQEIRGFIQTLDLEEKDREELLKLSPKDYTGKAKELVEKFVK